MNISEQHIKDLAAAFPELMETVADEVRKQINLQGHNLSGKLIRSVEVRIEQSTGRLTGQIWLEFYGLILEGGVAASRVPFTPSRRTGRRVSKYIQGLVDYFRRRGLPDREAVRAAFATATVHKREGMPTRASRRFSRAEGGERTGFLARAGDNTEQFIVDAIQNKAADLLTLRITQSLSQSEKIRI